MILNSCYSCHVIVATSRTYTRDVHFRCEHLWPLVSLAADIWMYSPAAVSQSLFPPTFSAYTNGSAGPATADCPVPATADCPVQRGFRLWRGGPSYCRLPSAARVPAVARWSQLLPTAQSQLLPTAQCSEGSGCGAVGRRPGSVRREAIRWHVSAGRRRPLSGVSVHPAPR